MNYEIFVLLSLLTVASILFVVDIVEAEIVALGLLILIVLFKLISPDEAFLGFGSDTVILFLGLLILTAALHNTGVVDVVGRWAIGISGKNPERLFLIVIMSVACLSTVISNTAATAFFLPVTFAVTRKLNVSPSRYLLPLAFSSIITSSVTLVSTSTNIVVSGLMKQYGMAPMGFFELAPVGIPISVAGLLYLVTIGKYLLPDRSEGTGPSDNFGLRPYLSDVIVLPTSALVGKSLSDTDFGSKYDLNVLKIVRAGQTFVPRPTTPIHADDVLLVEGLSENLLKIKDTAGIELKADLKLKDPSVDDEQIVVVEAIVSSNSPLIGRTLKSFRLRDRFNLQVLAVTRAGEQLQSKVSEVRIKMGDFFLIQGEPAQLKRAEETNAFQILTEVAERRQKSSKAVLSVMLFIGALVVSLVGVLPIHVSLLAGAVVALATRCITPEEAYRQVDWSLIILVGAMLSAGTAMEKTGAAKYLAEAIVNFTLGISPTYLLAGFFSLAVILTQIMSNQAAAVVLVPVAIQTALQMQLNPRTFAMTIAVASSCSYMTPLEPSCLMVYGPGRYKFVDFIKVGGLLTVIIFAISQLLIPQIWPLSP